MNAVGVICSLSLMLSVGLVSAVTADDNKPQAEVHTVSEGRFRVVVPLEGVFVTERMYEVSLRPETWTELTVVEAVEHGREVRKGDLLVRLDRRKIEEQIRDEEAARKHAMLAIEQLQAELHVLEPSIPVDLAAAERAKNNSDADLKNFLKIDRDLAQRSADLQIKSTEMRVDYAKDELDQLKKMYEADDLTEETEELILKRSRNQLELAQVSLEIARTRRDQIRQVQLPRKEADLREAVDRQRVAVEKARSTLPLSVTKMKLDLEKQEYELAKATEKLQKLERDAALLTVSSPADGVVYYGQCVDGEWKSAEGMRAKLRRGGTLTAHKVFVSVVDPAALRVRVGLPEKELCRLTTATTCQITPAANPRERLAARIERIPPIPGADGKFAAAVKLDGEGSEALHLAPGMKCKVKAIVYDADDAVFIPVKALHTDEFDDQKHFVNLVGEHDQHTRQDVTVGQRNEKSVEITSGLAAGEKILLDAPADEK